MLNYKNRNTQRRLPVNQIQKKIFTELSVKIFSGIYPSGSQIPGERELAHAYHTNIMNAKTAVNLLCRRGLVIRKRHKGTTVTAHTPEELTFIKTTLAAYDKLLILLCSRNGTNIHWDEKSVEAFCETAEKFRYHVKVLFLPERKHSLETLLQFLVAIHPEGIAILDDNFDHRLLYELRHQFALFTCPVVRHTRFGPSVPLNLPNTRSADIDHFRNGLLAGQLALEKEKMIYVTVNSDVPAQGDEDSLHCLNKFAGIHTAFRNAGLPLPQNYTWQESSLSCLADSIRKKNSGYVLIAINQEIAARVCDYLALQNLTAPGNYRILTIEDQKQYEKYSFSCVAVPKRKTGELMAFLACKKFLPVRLGDTCSFRLTGEIIRRKTF